MKTLNDNLKEILTVDGAMCVGLVDANSGMLLGAVGSGIDMEVAAAGNTEVVRAKLKTIEALSGALPEAPIIAPRLRELEALHGRDL